MNTRILFVDDDPGILEGLRNSLRRERDRWTLAFAGSGAEGLQALAAQPFDIVVSDMRMPHMDGAGFLAQVRVHAPRAVRIVLSGHAEPDAMLRAMPVAHQFLLKPCEPERLRDTLERASRFSFAAPEASTRDTLGALAVLPSPAALHTALLQALRRGDHSAAQLAEVVAQDPAAAAKLLQLVNSIYFGSGRPTISLEHALQMLGQEFLKALMLGGHFAAAREAGLATRAAARARCARQFLRCEPQADTAGVAALLCDVGTLALDPEAPPGHGGGHAAAGAWLLAAWGLPPEIVETVAHHRAPGALAQPRQPRVLAAVHAAEALLRDDGVPDADFLARAGCARELPRWREIARAQGGAAAT